MKAALDYGYNDLDIFPSLRPEYILMGRLHCRERIALGGYRLYNLLVKLFKGKEP